MPSDGELWVKGGDIPRERRGCPSLCLTSSSVPPLNLSGSAGGVQGGGRQPPCMSIVRHPRTAVGRGPKRGVERPLVYIMSKVTGLGAP